MLSAFTPTKHLGTRNNSVCVTNYDQSSFVAASSSMLFNGLNFTVRSPLIIAVDRFKI